MYQFWLDVKNERIVTACFKKYQNYYCPFLGGGG